MLQLAQFPNVGRNGSARTTSRRLPFSTYLPQPRGTVRCKASADEPKEASQPPVTTSATQSEDTAPLPNLTDPVDMVQWGGTLPEKRRLFLGGLTATGVALGGNFLGVTSFILGKNPELAQVSGLDIIVPVNGFKRCKDKENGYEYLYPASWLEDQRIALRNAEKRQLSLDPLSAAEAARRKRRRQVAEPVSAYGPPAGSGEENVSVIVAPILPGFSLAQMGDAAGAGQSLLDTTIAPPGSEKKATLLNAREEVKNGELYYVLEYTVETPRWARHNFAVFVSRDDTLYTFNSQASRDQWDKFQPQFSQMVDSFALLSTPSPGAQDASSYL